MNAFIAIIFASLLSRLGYQMARTPVLPIFAADLGAMPELIGVIVAASTITGVFFKLPSGALSDVLGRKRMMVLGALFFAAPPFLYPFVQDPWSLLALRFVHGFATAIFSPVASAYVASLAETGRGARLGWFSSANDIGATAGPLVGGFVLYFTTSYSLTYLLVGALGVMTLLVVLLLPDVDRPPPAAKTFSARAAEFRQGLAEVLRTPPIFVAAGIEAVMYLGYGAFLGFLPIYAKRAGLNDAEVAIVLGVQLALAMVAKPITGRVSDRVGRIPVIIIGLLLCAAALPLIFRSESLTAFVLLAPLLGLGVGAVTPVTNALIADLASTRRLGAAMGVFGTIWDVGEAAGPMIAGFLIGGLGYAATFDVLAAVTAAAAIGLMVLGRDPKEAGVAEVAVAADHRHAPTHGVSLREAFQVWLRVACLSFGGPAGQIAVMHRILVEEKRWISESRFLHALNYCMLLPGPEAQQLATYIGWLMHRTLGGIMAGVLFVIPGIIAIMALSYVYAGYGNVPVIAALFFGLKAAVLAIVLEAVFRIGKRSLKNSVMVSIAAAAFAGIFFLSIPFPIIIFGAALIGFVGVWSGVKAFQVKSGHGDGKKEGAVIDALLGDELPEHARPTVARALRASSVWLVLWLVPVIALLVTLGTSNVFSQIAVFFSKMAMVTFGGAYAVLAYVAQQAVENYGWLKPGEMLDGLGMAETTPGPLIMVLQFVGFMAAFREPGTLSPMLAGTLGGLLATWVTFTPCFLWIFLGAPFVETLRGNKALNGALSAITAAVVGVVLNLAIWFALHTVFRQVTPVHSYGLAFDMPVLTSVDPWALALSVTAIIAIFRFKVGMITTLLACSAVGIILHLVGLLS